MLNLRMTIFLALLVGIFIFFQYHFWFQSGGMRDTLLLKKKIATKEQENHHLKEMNEALLAQIKRLKTNVNTKEERARRELGMIKKDEMYYQIVK